MPRVADPHLHGRILTEALRILDSQGMHAVTMRTVASAAGVTTGAIYERFADRDELLEAVFDPARKDVLTALQSTHSIEEMANAFIGYFVRYPHRFELSLRVFDAGMASGKPLPAYELLKAMLARESSARERVREDLAMAITSLTFGTIRSMIAAGPETPTGKRLHSSALVVLRVLIASFG